MQLATIGGDRTRPALEKLRNTETDHAVIERLDRILGPR
jgi:hypothetical protein